MSLFNEQVTRLCVVSFGDFASTYFSEGCFHSTKPCNPPLWLHLQVAAYQKSGNKLGVLKSANESWTRIAVYVSLMALYVLGGQKVKTVGTCIWRRLDTLLALFPLY